MKKVFESYKEYVVRSKNYFKSAEKEISENNLRILVSHSFITMMLLLIFLAVAYIIIDGWKPSVQHIAFVPVSLLFYIAVSVYKKIGRKNKGRIEILCILYEIMLFSLTLPATALRRDALFQRSV